MSSLIDRRSIPNVDARRNFLLWSAIHEPLDELGTPTEPHRRYQLLLDYAPAIEFAESTALYADLVSLVNDYAAMERHETKTTDLRELIPQEWIDDQGLEEARLSAMDMCDKEIDKTLAKLVPTVATWVDLPVGEEVEAAS